MALDTSVGYGRRLIPQILDDLASSEPDRFLYSVADFSQDSQTFRHVTARSLAKAVDKTAWWLHHKVGNSASIRAVGYIGPHDLRHVLLTYASVKTGCSSLFLSPKNSVEGALKVLAASECNIWVHPRDQIRLPLVEDFIKQRSMTVLALPELDELLDAETVHVYPYTKTFDEVIQEPFCILHTSGSTGLPKPVEWSHGLIGTMDAVRLLPPTDGDNPLPPWTSLWKDGDRIYSSFPMSHGAGIIMNILIPSLFRLHCVMGPSGVPPNMDLVESLADHAKIDIWSMVPSLVDELGETPDVLAKLSSSKFICASGGPVSPIAASKVNDVIRVLNLTGTTEGLFIGNLVVEREDWFWFAFHPFSGFEFKEVEPNIYEHWVHRNEHWPLFQGIFHTFPTEQSINLKDLYTKHPTKPNLWAFNGRSDDIVVLSNGYKISPLDTEALITTHPAIKGALVIGTGKHQAGLLIELNESVSRNNELFDSIWLTVERANALSVHKNQLQRDYITFAESEKPFVRTDKGTVKRRVTLALYNDYIERFYDSRSEDLEDYTVDTSSIDSTIASIRKVMGSLLPAVYKVSTNTDLFSLGLDSLQVFRAVKRIRAATGLQDQLAPRHLYANPTITKFSAVVSSLLDQARAREANETSLESAENDNVAKMKRMIDEHKRRQPIKMNPFDQVNFNHYMGLNFFLELRKGADFKTVFALLQQGLSRTFRLIPALGGKIMNCSEGELGYKKGDLCVTIPPLLSSASSVNDTAGSNEDHQLPSHLAYNDLSQVLPAFAKLKETGFVHPKLKDELLLTGYAFPQLPADILIAQANFVKGGCILAANFHHGCVDGIGVMIALRVWAESCRYLQGDKLATCSWLDPESFNHSLPSILYAQEGYARPAHEVDPGVWGFLPFLRPEVANNTLANGTSKWHDSRPADGNTLPPAPVFARKFDLPPIPPKDGCYLSTTYFLIPPEKIEKLRQEVVADPEARGVVTSISDILQAFFWRAAIRARYRVAKKHRGATFGPDDISILELPIDGRPYFSPLLPSSYMGSMLLLNRQSMPLEKLCDPQTSLGSIAYLLREVATRLCPSLFHDAYTLLNSLPNYDNFTIANMGIRGHFNAMISNLMLFQTSEISFGNNLFANGGSPDAMRPQVERGHKHFRFLVIYPMKSDGSAELGLGTLPEELEMLKTDEEFTKYATLVDTNI